MKYSTSVLFTAGLAAAQSSVVNIMLPFADEQDIGASVISAAPTATKYFISCPPGTSAEDCGLAEGVEVLYGPSTLEYTMSYLDIYTVSANCKLTPSKDAADCTGALISDGETSTVVEVLKGYSSYFMPVTITAGLEKLSAGGGAAATSTANSAAPASSATDGPVASTTMATAPAPTGTEGSEGTGEGAADPTSSLSTGGMPRVTQNAVVMGAAALVGGAMLL